MALSREAAIASSLNALRRMNLLGAVDTNEWIDVMTLMCTSTTESAIESEPGSSGAGEAEGTPPPHTDDRCWCSRNSHGSGAGD